jgi:tol-pal system protein YbgF
MQDRKLEARKAFTEFLSRHPQSDLVGNAQYWLAETYYVAKEYDAAMQEFSKVVQQYPNSSKVPDSMLKSGFIQYERKQWDLARKQLEDLVSRYPGSDASQLAQKRLDRMFREGH